MTVWLFLGVQGSLLQNKVEGFMFSSQTHEMINAETFKQALTTFGFFWGGGLWSQLKF